MDNYKKGDKVFDIPLGVEGEVISVRTDDNGEDIITVAYDGDAHCLARNYELRLMERAINCTITAAETATEEDEDDSEYVSDDELEMCRPIHEALREHHCRGCNASSSDDGSVSMQYDAYGIQTGYWCGDCYDDPTKYSYRKDRYNYAENGECLDDDEF